MTKHDQDKDEASIEDESVSELIDEIEKPTGSSKSKPRGIKKLHPRHLLVTKKRKVIAIIVVVILVLGIIFAIPVTRYFLLSSIVKKDVTLTVIDSTTKRPISDAEVTLGDVTAKTNKDGVVSLRSVKVGEFVLKITKKYYSDSNENYTVPVIFTPASPTYLLVATGRQVNVTITNKITGDPVDGIKIAVNDTSATTNSDGTAVIILPPTDDIQKATLSGSGYDSADVDIFVNDDGATNAYTITPVGSIYYLSKATGKINVMKANLDGSDATVVVQATGQESDYGTSLLSARDWKYSALLAKRTVNKERLYLLNSSDDSLSVIDEGNATFQIIGWSGHNFLYIVNRVATNYWDNKKQAIKSYNADTGNLVTIDETSGSGSNNYDYQYSYFGRVYVLENEVVYSLLWSFGNQYQYQDPNKKVLIISADSTKGTKKTVKEFAATQTSNYFGLDTRSYEPRAVYIRTQYNTDAAVFYEYENQVIKSVTDTNDDKFYDAYPTFLISPSGKKTLWYELRDGKNTLFIGDSNGANAKQIGTLSEYTPYGWYGSDDSYILLTKKGSELYIASASKDFDIDGTTPLKITDYHKTQSYPGYGSGYGGQ